MEKKAAPDPASRLEANICRKRIFTCADGVKTRCACLLNLKKISVVGLYLRICSCYAVQSGMDSQGMYVLPNFHSESPHLR